jgi:hypothetical protein
MAVGLGQDLATVREQLRVRFAEGAAQGIAQRPEDISYITPDGKQERQQVVLTQGRGIVYCHIYAYGDDLFIGWDAHLNYGQWAETTVVRGYDPRIGRPVIVNTVVPGTARATEYDLIDLNSLTEWAHARVTQVAKAAMLERRLDQEIDFKIVRGERQGLVSAAAAAERKPLFRRAAAAVQGH